MDEEPVRIAVPAYRVYLVADPDVQWQLRWLTYQRGQHLAR
jgi:hypothetical protein